MSDLQNQLLLSPSRTPFEEKFEREAIKNLLQTVSSKSDKYSVLIEAEKNPATLREAKFYHGDIRDSLNELKEMLLQLEKMTRGTEQRNETSKLRDMYTKSVERHTTIYKEVQQSCSEDQKDLLKHHANERSNEKNEPMFNEKFEKDGSVAAQGFMQNASMDGIQLEHIDWQNQVIKENAELNNIEQNLSQEVDRQDGELDVNETQNRGHQYDNCKKYFCMLLGVLVVICIKVGFILLNNYKFL